MKSSTPDARSSTLFGVVEPPLNRRLSTLYAADVCGTLSAIMNVRSE
jgi:hypothetical protein